MGARGGSRPLPLLLAMLLWRAGPERLESRGENPAPGPVNTTLLSRPCGHRSIRSLIVGGAQSARGRWPWQASVHLNRAHRCGGSLLGRRWVLTAAHCFKKSSDPYEWTVLIGELTLKPSPWNLRFYRNRYRIQDIIVHPEANKQRHDIALLRLASLVTYNKYIQPICILSSTFLFQHRPDCWVTGWGVLHENQQPLPPPYHLREVQVTILNNTRCRDLFEMSRHSLISDDMVCAGAEDGSADTCRGDSGGPLVCDQDGLWYQVGVVSWGEGCGRPNRPGVYTNVSQHLDWIRTVMILSGASRPDPSPPLLFLTLSWAPRLLGRT